MSKGRGVCIRAVGRFAVAWRSWAAILLMGLGCAAPASAATYRDCYKTQLYYAPVIARCAETVAESLQIATVIYDHYFDFFMPPGLDAFQRRTIYRVSEVIPVIPVGRGANCGLIELNSHRYWRADSSGHMGWTAWGPYEPYYLSCGASWTVHTQKQIIDILRTSPPVCCDKVGNPLLPLFGIKRETVDTGLSVAGEPLRLTYDTTPRAPQTQGFASPPDPRPSALGPLWSSSFHRRVHLQGDGRVALVARGNGDVVSFRVGAGGAFVATPDSADRLSYQGSGYLYVDARARAQEVYDAEGNLTSITRADGSRINLSYTAMGSPSYRHLTGLQDAYGRGLTFTYSRPMGLPVASPAMLQSVSNTNGDVLTLGYDTELNLTSIAWPDNSTRRFVYESGAFPWALTGIIDELGQRYATFGYDSDGRAISTEHSGGTARFSVVHATPPQVVISEVEEVGDVIYRYWDWALPVGTQVFDAAGVASNWSGQVIQGRIYGTGRTQVAGAGSPAGNSIQVRDSNGNVIQDDDFSGARTCRTYDLSRNLETMRMEGLTSGTPCGGSAPPGARVTTTQWHPDWNLPTQVNEPGRITSYVYNGQPDPFNGGTVASCASGAAALPNGKPIAVLCKRVEQATTDSNGQAGSGVAQVHSATYNARGQRLTETDPLGNVTTFSYQAQTDANARSGDLIGITNPLGHLTGLPRYDQRGRVLRVVEPGGATTDYGYDTRGRVQSINRSGLITSLSYLPSGELQQVTQPDGSWLLHEYDAARRLMAISNQLGHRITYVLDAKGNRILESSQDSSGTVRRILTRVVDALNRVQQVTGRE